VFELEGSDGWQRIAHSPLPSYQVPQSTAGVDIKVEIFCPNLFMLNATSK